MIPGSTLKEFVVKLFSGPFVSLHKVMVYSRMRRNPLLSTPMSAYPSLPFNAPGHPTTRMRLNTSGEQKVDVYIGRGEGKHCPQVTRTVL